MTEKQGQIQGKLDCVRVSGEFELTEFELAGFYCSYFSVKVSAGGRYKKKNSGNLIEKLTAVEKTSSKFESRGLDDDAEYS